MAYTKTNWQDLPNTTTPINATNLNKIENELETLDTKTTGISYSSNGTNLDTNLNITQNVAQIQHNGTNFIGNLADGRTIISADNTTIYIRPKGYGDATKSLMLTTDGSMTYDGKLVATGGWENYSTNEIVIGTWIDGSTIYRKVVAIPEISQGQTIVGHGISGLSRIINIDIQLKNSQGLLLPLPYITNYDTVYYYLNSGSIVITSLQATTGFTGYAVIDYLKS